MSATVAPGTELARVPDVASVPSVAATEHATTGGTFASSPAAASAPSCASTLVARAGGVFAVVGRSVPIAISDIRTSRRWTVTAYATAAHREASLRALLTSETLLYIHVPATSSVPGGYVSVGDLAEHIYPTSDMSLWTLPCTEVAAPGPDVVGHAATCADVLETFATCADLLAAFPTCADLADWVANPEEVIVNAAGL